MAFRAAIPVQEVPAGAVREAVIEGRNFAVCNIDGNFFAVSGDCPHRNGPLGHGVLHGYELVCPWHAWGFDVRTGYCETGPGGNLATFPVKIWQGQICVQVD